MATIGATHSSIPFAERKRQWIRRRLIVDGPFQYRMLLPVIVFTMIQVALLLTTMFYPLYKTASLEGKGSWGIVKYGSSVAFPPMKQSEQPASDM